jgi:hypothetical protein
MPAPTGVVSSQFVRLGFEAKGIQATINLPDCALSALIALIKVKDSPNIWAILEMACEWKFADADEQENIRRTISELLESNAKVSDGCGKRAHVGTENL